MDLVKTGFISECAGARQLLLRIIPGEQHILPGQIEAGPSSISQPGKLFRQGKCGFTIEAFTHVAPGRCVLSSMNGEHDVVDPGIDHILHCIAIPLAAALLLAIHFWRVRKDGGISGRRWAASSAGGEAITPSSKIVRL